MWSSSLMRFTAIHTFALVFLVPSGIPNSNRWTHPSWSKSIRFFNHSEEFWRVERPRWTSQHSLESAFVTFFLRWKRQCFGWRCSCRSGMRGKWGNEGIRIWLHQINEFVANLGFVWLFYWCRCAGVFKIPVLEFYKTVDHVTESIGFESNAAKHCFRAWDFVELDIFHWFWSAITFLFNTRSVLDFGTTLGCIKIWHCFGVARSLSIDRDVGLSLLGLVLLVRCNGNLRI